MAELDKTLESFLHPHRRENIRFKLSSFDEEFEMKALTAAEDLRIAKKVREKDLSDIEALACYAAEALVVPNLHSKKLLDALSEREGHKILSAYDALKIMFNGAEVSALVEIYQKHANVVMDFQNEVEEAKN